MLWVSPETSSYSEDSLIVYLEFHLCCLLKFLGILKNKVIRNLSVSTFCISSLLLVRYFPSLSLESSVMVPIVAVNSQVLLKSKLGATFLT